ncbi:MAG TPA: M4 family metallopeptidase [Holophagaceae bacterium]|nr:M4 family metallopeptidase [Holophagaceae bacterium]
MKNAWSAAPALVSILAAGGLGAANPVAKAALAPNALSALANLRTRVAPAGFDLVVESVKQDERGATHARLQQTYHGVPIWGAQAMLQVAADGSSSTPITTLVQGDLGLDVKPTVAPDKAVRAALKRLAPAAPMERNPEAELVLFPAVHAPRLKFTTSLENGKAVHRLDTEHSALGRSVDQGDWALAYHVHTEVSDRKEGPRFTDYIVDARSGKVLEIWDSLRRDQAPKPHIAQATIDGLPVFNNAKGVGHSEYSGDVTLDVTDDTANTGQFILQDTKRSFDLSLGFGGLGAPNPATGDYGITAYNLGGSGFDFPAGDRMKFTNPAATWGDGQLWNANYNDYSGVNPETAAVDAMHGAEAYWDMLYNVYGIRGLDFGNTGIALRTHKQALFTSWNPAKWSVDVVDFETFLWPDGVETPPQSMAQPEIIAHEMTHGLVSSFVQLDLRGETGGVEESICDVFSAMVKFYTGGAGGQGSTIPDTDGSPSGKDAWTFGLQVLGNGSNFLYPIRSMAMPQSDGRSVAAWYHGISNLDPHYTSGIGNRAFYFLSQGAAPYGGPDDQVASSYYVPAGFPGIGNQKAALLWLEAFALQLPNSSANYHTLRLALTYAAYNRFGPDSPEFAAMENAFAAVNIGAAHGQPARPLVTLEANSGSDIKILVPDGVAAFALVGYPTKPFTAHVTDATDKTVIWSAPDGGQISQDGTYLPPNLPNGFGVATIATSQADPYEYAKGISFLINPDVDDDLEFDAVDAVDLGGQLTVFRGNHSADLFPDGALDDGDVEALLESFSLVYTK